MECITFKLKERQDIAEILLKFVLNTNQSINQSINQRQQKDMDTFKKIWIPSKRNEYLQKDMDTFKKKYSEYLLLQQEHD